MLYFSFFFQAEDGIRDLTVTGVQTCALPTTSAGRTRCSASKKQGACSATRRTSAGGSCSSRARALTSLAGRGRDRGGLAPGTASEEQRRGLAAARGEAHPGMRRQRLKRLDVGQRRALVEGLGQQPVALV